MASKSLLLWEDYIRVQTPILENNGFKGSINGSSVKEKSLPISSRNFANVFTSIAGTIGSEEKHLARKVS